MIKIDRNKITVNQHDTCIVELSLCDYKLSENDIIEFTFNGTITTQKYDNLDIIIPTDEKGIFNYSVVILHHGVIRTEIIRDKCEVI